MLHKEEAVVVLRFAERESREVEILSKLASSGPNPHTPFVHGSCQKRGVLWIVQERAAHGSLKAALDNKSIEAGHLKCAAAQIANAMSFLETQRIVHADLSCPNVLVFKLSENLEDTVCKVTDFGLSIALPESSSFEIRKQPRAVRWSAPETIVDSRHSHKSDAWSLGATRWELFSGGQTPWPTLTKRAAVAQRLADLAADHELDVASDFPQPDGCGAHEYSLIMNCLQADEQRRFGASDAQYTFKHQTKNCAQFIPSVEKHAREQDDVCSTAAASVESPMHEDSVLAGNEPLDTLSAFFHSKEGVQAFGEQAGQTMLRAIADARAREAELVSKVNMLTSKLAEADRKLVLQHLERPAVVPFSSKVRSFATPLVHLGSAHLPPRIAGAWCLYSVGRAASLERLDFPNRDAAMRAFSKCVAPCIMRDPNGAEAAAHLWASSYGR
jgi:serine/threonine protein kinase